MFDLNINYSASVIRMTKLNVAFCPHVNNTDECVWRAVTMVTSMAIRMVTELNSGLIFLGSPEVIWDA